MPGRLTNIWDMKTTEINQSIIGKRCAYSGGYPFSISGDIRSVPS